MFLSALLLRGITDRLRYAGVQTDELLLSAGLEPGALADPSARVPVDAADRFFSRAMKLTGDPGLGLTLANDTPAGAHTVIYHMALACSSAREAMVSFQRIAGQLVAHAAFELVEQGEIARFAYRSPLSLGDTSRFGDDFVLAFAHRLATHFYRSPSDRPISVSFRHARPSYADRYTELFGCPVTFNTTHSEIVFYSEFLDWGHYLGNDTVKQSFEENACKLLSSRSEEEPTSERIRVLLRCTGDFEAITTETIARRLGMSERSLRRKLQSEGVSLTQILDRVRREIACEELARPQACIQGTAERLGFADRTAFHRAFKRWMGETPQAYRTRAMI